MDTVEKVLICIIVALTSFITGAICYQVADKNMKEQAVVRGYAEWKVNDRGEEVKFVWKK